MSEALKHRGPDDQGFFFDDRVALGNTRLSIIDIKGGHQPIHNEDSALWIVFNGEIYNFQDLRVRLENLGHRFYTDSDTEVIVHAYEQWGENCVKEFNGMWAFAIWDSNKKQLFLSRDRLGIKPLYYFSDGKRFIFASEIKAIILDESIPRVPNDRMIYEYLMYGLHDHTEETFFGQIKRLLPAHNLLLHEGSIHISEYWSIPKITRDIESPDTSDALLSKEFLRRFQDSVRLQLVSEVPVGTCLSGGLDSSSIVCTINQMLSLDTIEAIGERQKTFTVCFEDKQIDEREYIKEVIARTRTEENLIFPSSRQLWEDLESLVFFQEEPFMSSSVYAQWCVMKLASSKVKVVLDGQGGDELLAGYEPYYLTFILDLWRKKKIGTLVRELQQSLDTTGQYIKQYVFSSYRKRLKGIVGLLDSRFASEFLSTEMSASGREDLSGLLHQEMTKTSLPRLLRYEDKNSMAFSVEARVPFLDHRLVEYVFSLPANQRLRDGWTKYILRNAMKGILPEKIRTRRRKIGFAVPEAAWLRELENEIRGVFASQKFGNRKYFNQEEVLKGFDEFCQGKSDLDANIFWHILNLEMWLRVFIDQ